MATCDVSITVENGGTARSGVLVMAQHVPPQSNIAQTVVVSRAWQTATTDSNGLATITMEQGTRARIVCDDAGLDIEFDVPQSSTYNIAEEDYT